MNNIGIFLNNRSIDKGFFNISDAPVAFGDWCLTPVRCLFDGNKVTVSNKNGSLTVDHEKEYANSDFSWGKPKRNLLRVIASILFIIPGLIIGSAFNRIYVIV